MFQPKNSKLPLSKSRLNFYIAKRAREVLQDSSITISHPSNTKKSPQSKKIIQKQTHDDSFFGKSIQSIGSSQNYPFRPENQRKAVEYNCSNSFSRFGILKNKSLNNSPRFTNKSKEDSLDQIISSNKYDILFSERGEYYRDNQSQLSYLKNQNCLPFDKQNRGNLRWINCFKQTMRDRQEMKGDKMKQLSNKLSAINYQMNRNSKKLKELCKVQTPLGRPCKQQTLKRVNFKYSQTLELQKTQAQKLQRIPRVQYHERAYNQPKFLIWHPMH